MTPRPLVLTGALIVALAVGVGRPAGSGSASAPPLPDPGSGRTSCAQVVHIGDSTSVGLVDPAYIAEPTLRIDAQYARVGVTDFRNEISGARSTVETLPGQDNAYQVAAEQKESGYEGCWVLALGTTDAANLAVGGAYSAGERIDRMFEVIGDDPVLWVDVKTLVAEGAWANQHMEAWDEALTAAQARHPNLRVYRWSTVVRDDWFQGDGIHYTSAGYAARARLIADALAEAFPASEPTDSVQR